jgi:hypothetical protein
VTAPARRRGPRHGPDELYDLGVKHDIKFEEHLSKVKPNNITRVAKKYLKLDGKSGAVLSVVAPEPTKSA